MKFMKIGLAIAAVSAVLFVVGCATKPCPPQPQTYHSKLGTRCAQNDMNK
jgi:hypothetical protein